MRLIGTVVQGEKKAGKEYDLPTANLALTTPADLAPGIYVGQASYGGQTFPCIISQGTKFEVHLFGHEADLYGKELTVDVGEKVSDFVPFENDAQMKEKIAQDVAEAKGLLGLA